MFIEADRHPFETQDGRTEAISGSGANGWPDERRSYEYVRPAENRLHQPYIRDDRRD